MCVMPCEKKNEREKETMHEWRTPFDLHEYVANIRVFFVAVNRVAFEMFKSPHILI